MTSRLAQEILSLKNLALRPHDTCEDCWYSCPKSGESCNEHYSSRVMPSLVKPMPCISSWLGNAGPPVSLLVSFSSHPRLHAFHVNDHRIRDECTCGADKHNAKVEALYAEITRML